MYHDTSPESVVEKFPEIVKTPSGRSGHHGALFEFRNCGLLLRGDDDS